VKKVIEGYLGGSYDDLGIFKTKEDAQIGMFPNQTMDDLMSEFKVKKIRITIEDIKEVE